jgi:hypothetical protein
LHEAGQDEPPFERGNRRRKDGRGLAGAAQAGQFEF